MAGRPLRSNFAPGTPRWAVRRAQWRALGLSDADLEKPKIAVVNTSSELSSCFSHLDGVAAAVKQAVRDAGGLAFEVRTAAPSDFITSAGRQGRYILPSRDLLVNDIEVQVEGAMLDGMVCLASCDKTAPGQLMAAARLDIPTIVVACGYQPHGVLDGHAVDIEEVYESVGKVAAGHITLAQLGRMCDVAIRGPGVCAGMGTANTMHIASEALGLALPGSTPVLANGDRMFAFARAAGARIVQMVWEDLKPSRLLTPQAFENAVMVGLALSASINLVRHLQAVAVEARCPVDIYELYDRLGPKVPLLCAVRPNGATRIEELEAAGGTLGVMKRLGSLVHRDALTVSGRPWAEEIAAAPEPGPTIRTVDDPISRQPSVIVMRGNLAPDGSILKLGDATGKQRVFDGRALVFRSQEDALEALGAGRLVPGTVAVLAGMGCRGGPGMALASGFVAAVDGAGLSTSVAVVTDGQLSGLNRGIAIGQVSPEAAMGGPIGWVRDGDRVVIDVAAHTVTLAVDEAELAARRAAGAAFAAREERGWLSIYERVVQPMSAGAALVEPVSQGRAAAPGSAAPLPSGAAAPSAGAGAA
jgi:dihydroxy-acid dehydratase